MVASPAPPLPTSQQHGQPHPTTDASAPLHSAKHARPSPRKRALPADTFTAAEPANDGLPRPANVPSIRQLHRQQLATVVQSLAPSVVLEQHLTVPGAPASLPEALADPTPLLPLSVLRACVNEACTSALLSSAMALDAPSEQDSARLLNDVDRFQEAILAVLDELEVTYRREDAANGGEKGIVKPEQDDGDAADAPPPSKVRRYMLHRTLPTGVDVFTSAAVLSDYDLEALSKLDDTDVIAVHPPPTPSTSSYAVDPSLAQADSAPVPKLGEVDPRPLGWQNTRHIAPVAKVGAAPGLYGSEAALRADPTFLDPLHPTRRPTVLLPYASPFLSSLAPAYDSTGATESYHASASRALSQLRSRRWLDASLGQADSSASDLVLSEEEAAALRGLGIDIEEFLAEVRTPQPARTRRPRSTPPVASTTTTEAAVWAQLERNAALIVRVARAQVARARVSYDDELRRIRARAEKAAAVAKRPVAAGPAAAAQQRVEEAVRSEEEKAEGEGERAGTQELEDANALLDSLVALIASVRYPETSPSHATPRLLPPPAFLAKLAPLLLGARAREPSYRGTLDPVNDRALKMREAVSMAPPTGTGGLGGEVDLDVKV